MTPALILDARMWRASGIGTYLQNLVPRLAPYFALRLVVHPDQVPHLSSYDCQPEAAPIYSVREQWAIRRHVRRGDIFWSPHYNAPLAPVAARRRVVTIHDVFHLAFAPTLTLPQQIYARTVLPRAARRADLVLTVSEFSRGEIHRYTGVPLDRIRVIPNGVDHALFQPASAEAQRAVRARYRLPGRYLVYVGNLKPHKNLMTLLRAFRQLIADPAYDDLQLTIVGQQGGFITGDPAVVQALQAPDLHGRTVLTGFVPATDLPALYTAAAAFVFPSRYEGFGLPPLEAMACGCPTVVSAAASLPEVCGEASRYVMPEDADHLAATLADVLTDADLRTRLRARGLAHVGQFRWEKSAEAHRVALGE